MSKGLKALESLVDTMPLALIETNSMREIKIIEKELKALEIIKRCRVDFHIFKRYTRYGLEQYNDEVWDDERLTQEEYNLLKEVLL